MELKQQIDRLWDKVQPWAIPAIVIVIVGIPLWRFQQDNVDSLQSKIEHLKKEIAHPSSTNEKLRLEERLKLDKDILVIEKDKTTIQNGIYTTLVQALGGVILSITAYVGYRNFKIGEENLKVAQKNLKVTEDKQVSERFSKAIEHLGSEKIDVCLGGIYTLEQIAFDSPKYHWTIVEILSAFIREKRTFNNTDIVGIDIQAALTVLGRRKIEQDPGDKHIDLRNVDLEGVELQNANLSSINFSGANLENVDFCKVNLSNSNLSGVNFTKAKLFCANFNDADLSGIPNYDHEMVCVEFGSARLYGATFINAKLSNVNFYCAHLQGTNFSNARLFNVYSFKTAYLGGREINDILFTGANFTSARLYGDLRNTNFADADLNQTNINSADLSGADLSKCKNLTQEQLDSAHTDNNTKLPDCLTTSPTS